MLLLFITSQLAQLLKYSKIIYGNFSKSFS